MTPGACHRGPGHEVCAGARQQAPARVRPVPAGGHLERTLTSPGGSTADKWLKSRLTSEDGTSRRSGRGHVMRATYRMGAGSGTVEALQTGLSDESPFWTMNACQDSGAVEPRR
ncbi:hypothetical protein GCM10010398_71600 [Streptomyces fimbriatus]